MPACDRSVRQLRIAAGVWSGYEFIFLARKQGWLDSKQVQLFELPSNASSLRALAAGSVDGAALTIDEVLRARAEGLPLTIVLIFDVSAGADMLLVRPKINALGELRGKRIGLDKTTNAALLMAVILRQAELPPGAVILEHIPIGSQLKTWEMGGVDGVITYEPVSSKLQAIGAKRLFDTSQAPQTIIDVLALRSDLVKNPDYEESISTLISAHFRALNLFRSSPEQTAKVMTERLGIQPEEILKSYQQLLLPDLAANHHLLGDAQDGIQARAGILSEIMVAEGIIKQPDSLVDLVSNRFLPNQTRS